MATSFNIVLRSGQKFAGTDNHTLTYALDWSFLPDGVYEVRFAFRSELTNLDTTEDIARLEFPDFAPMNSYEADPLGAFAHTSRAVGFVKLVEVAEDAVGNMYFSAGYDDNPCFVMNKPQNNFFRVLLCDTQGNTNTFTKEYCMMLNFKKICSCDKYK